MYGNPFNLAYPQLNSSDRTANLKSKTNYAAAVNLAKNGGVLTKRNGSKYAGSVHTTSTAVTSADSYADLLDVTKGKYLPVPPPPNPQIVVSPWANTSNGLGEIYLGGFMVTNYATAKVPVTIMGLLLNGEKTLNKLSTTATIVVDPNLNLFYGLCNTRNYLKNVQLDPSISYNQQQARGFHYPARVNLNPVDCVDCVTVKYVDSSIATVPTFVYANPRGTGFEWFAVVNDTSKSMITDYAKNVSSGSGRTYFTTSGNVVPFNNIVTTLVTDMSSMFLNASTFNQPLSSWDTSNVTNMKYMFYGASAFNGNITTWNTANVLNMNGMFYNAIAFNQNIRSWNVIKVTNHSDFSTGSALLSVGNSPAWIS
jgi:hypothetical protein